MPKPLGHFKILDLSRILAGPFATQLLADFGAEVLKIEPPSGDPTRGWGPPFDRGDQGESAYFRCANRGKQSIRMDLRDAGDRETLADLMAGADVLVENFLPDSRRSWGSPGSGSTTAPQADRGLDPGLRLGRARLPPARLRFHHPGRKRLDVHHRRARGRPMKVGVALADVLAALYTANGIQAALLHRERTGEALHIEVPLMEAALAGLVNVGAGTLMTGKPPERLGNAHPQIVPYQTFPCSDGEAAIGVGSDRQFEVLALWAGIDLEAESGWRTNRGRVRDRDRLVPVLERHFRGSDRGRRPSPSATPTPSPPAGCAPWTTCCSARPGNLHRLDPRPSTTSDRRPHGPGAGLPGAVQRRARLLPLPPPRWPG